MLIIEGGADERQVQVEIAGQPVTFTVGPENFEDLMLSYKWTQERGLLQKAEAAEIAFGEIAVGHVAMMRRIKGWSGLVDSGRQPLPCTEETKMLVFGRYPGVLLAIAQKLAETGAVETKNSETSPAG